MKLIEICPICNSKINTTYNEHNGLIIMECENGCIYESVTTTGKINYFFKLIHYRIFGKIEKIWTYKGFDNDELNKILEDIKQYLLKLGVNINE